MQLEVIHAFGSDEWCVTVDGKCVVGFAGPDAQSRAVLHREELQQLITGAVGDALAALASADSAGLTSD